MTFRKRQRSPPLPLSHRLSRRCLCLAFKMRPRPPSLWQVIKLDKLRTQYKDFKDRRQLLSQFDLFLADDRILPMLTKALGKTFLKAKKQPVPIKLERRKSFAGQIARARDSAFLVGSYGDCWAVKLANTAMTEDQVVENLIAGIAAVVEKIPRKWKNVKAINIKCSSSVALPVYSNIGDLRRAPPAKKARAAAKEEGEGEGDKEAEADGGVESSVDQRKKRKPRPLIRQQLNKLKEEAKAEKAEAAKAKAAKASPAKAKVEKAETAKANPAKAKAETAKANPPKAKAETAKAKGAKANPAKAKAEKAETAKAEGAKANPAKANLAKANPAKAKAAKAKAAEEAAAAAGGGAKRKKRKKMAASENEEPNKSTVGEDEDSGPQAAGGEKVKGKAKSPKAAGGSAVKATKRRRTAVA